MAMISALPANITLNLSDKHSSFLRYEVSYHSEKFYNTGPSDCIHNTSFTS
jgi:hypothetical protein